MMHEVKVFRIDPKDHPTADTLGVQEINGYSICLKKQDWQGFELGAWVPPDSVVDTTLEEFSWLAPHKNKNFREAITIDADLDKQDSPKELNRYHRVTCIRLRGILSYGLMVPIADPSLKEGMEIGDLLQVTRFVNNETRYGASLTPPNVYAPEYDLEDFNKYSAEVFPQGTQIHVHEKLDGVSARFVYADGEYHVGSRSMWLEHSQNAYWRILEGSEKMKTFLKENPNIVLYGEIVGFVKGLNTKLRYKCQKDIGEINFYLFDVLKGATFFEDNEVNRISDLIGFSQPPLIWKGAIESFGKEHAEGPSLVDSSHMREGVVIRSALESRTLFGRSILKLVSSKFLMS